MKRIDTHKPNSRHIAKKLMASALALTLCIPYVADTTYDITKSLKAYAEGYNGGGSSFGGPATTTGTSSGAIDYGLRIYVYDYEKKEILRDSRGQMVVDLVHSNFRNGYIREAGTSTRVGTVSGKIGRLCGSYPDSILKMVYSGNGTITCTGSVLAKYLKTKDENGQYVNMRKLLSCFDQSKITSTCYVVIEPTLLVNNCYYDSWQGYVEGGLGGNLETDKDDVRNLQVAGDGFSLTSDDTNLGINEPTKTIDSMRNQWGAHDRKVSDLRHTGYGIHLFNLSETDIVKSTDPPINTYDVEDKPDHPSHSETPKDTPRLVDIDDPSGTPHKVELKNSGDVNIIKVYMDAYVDKQNSPEISGSPSGDKLNTDLYTKTKKYTGIEQVAIYGTKSTTKDVVVQDEFDESKYHLVGWETSSKDWRVDGNNIVLPEGTNAWNGADWLQVKDSSLKINDGHMKTVSQLSSNRARYNTTNITTSRSKIGTVEGADSAVNHKWDYKATDGAIVGKYSQSGKEDDKQKITLADNEKTIYVLYVREKPWVETNEELDPPPKTSITTYPFDPDTKISTRNPGDNDDKKEKDGGLNIVKVYGIIDGGDDT